VVVIVDQLEELFSQASPADADAFMDAVAVAVSDRTSRVRFVTTLRADFYDRPLRHGTFGDLLRLGTEVITPMNAAELGGAITAPASEVGVSFEDGLPALIAADLADQGTALPLLQHALTELFARRTGKTVTTDAYREIGGVTGALAQRAESILGDLDNDRAVAREVFLRLVTVAEGSADTRRNALVSDLVASIGGGVAPVLDAFSRHRLVTFDRDPVTRSPSVEISHEALITEWTRLRHWIDDARADVASRQRLTEATHEWVEHDRSDEFTLTGARLGRYEGWLDGPPVRLTDTERAFLAASHDLSDHALHIEQRRVRRLRRLVAAVGVGLVLALVGGAFALIQQRRADEARVDAELATLISNISAVGADDPELAVLLALEAQARAPGSVTDRAVLAALADATVASRIVSRQPLVDDCTGGTFFTDGGVDGIIEIATVDGRLLARSPVSGEVRQSASPPQPCMIGATSGSFGFAGSVDGSLVVAGPNFDVVVDSGPGSFPIDASSNRALIGSRDGIGLYDLGTGSRVGPIIEGLFVSDSAFSADESLIALGVGYEDGRGNDGAFVVLDTASGEPVTEIAASMPGPVAFDDSTGELIVADNDGVSIVDARTGEISNRIPSVEITGYLAVGPIPDGRLALVSRGGIEVVDRTTDAVLSSVGIQNLVQAFVVPDGLVVTVNDVLQSGVYDLDTNALIDGNLEFDSVAVAAFGQGRAMLANAFADEGVGSVEIVNLDSGERSFPELRSADGGPFPAAVLFPEADGFWAVSHPGHVVGRWENGELVDELFLGSGADVRNDDYYPGGRRFREYLAAIGRRPDMTSEVSLIRLGRDDETAEVVFTVDTGFSALDPSNDFGMAHPSVDGGVYVIDNLGQLRIHDATGALVDEIETPVTAPVSIALDPTGSRLALSSQAGIVVVYDTVTWEMIEVPAPAIASQLTFDGDGSTLAISTWSGEVRIFDVESGDTPVTVWTGGGTFASEPGWYDAATDTVWVTASGRLLQIPVDPAAWVEQACSVLDRDLTKAEWDRYVPGEQPLRTVCE
jgi:WD40 repeat protein